MRQAMNRIFLTILALFAGIATQVAPAEARVRGDTEIGTTLNLKAAARVAAAVQVAAEFRPEASVQVAEQKPDQSAFHLSGFTAKTVQIGPDRARE
jgi:hypothetical protein